MGIIVDGKELEAPGLVVKNFNDPSVFHFKNQPRPTKAATEVVVHETVGPSWAGTVEVLKQRGLGVHFIVDHDGTVYQHADLLTEEMWHASQHNPMSVGIETVNPFDPRLAPKDGPWTEVLDNTPWTLTKNYLLPTAEEAEAVCQLLNWLSSAAANPLTIPQKWPGLSRDGDKVTMALGNVARLKMPPTPGILAHYYWEHGDGVWLVLYSWLRLELGLDAPTAREKAKELAQGTHAADLSYYFNLDPYLLVG